MDAKANYSMPLIIESEYCDRNGNMRVSSMLSKCQTMASVHLDLLGENRTNMFNKGLFWVIVRTNAQIARMPKYAEDLIFNTWVGKTRFSLFPRFHEILTKDGEVLVRISSTWAVINAESRKFVTAEEHGLAGMVYEDRGTELPQRVKFPKDAFEGKEIHSQAIQVPFSYLDINGHMNNTKYFDLADNLLPSPRDGKALKAFSIEYENEIKQDDEITVNWVSLDDNKYYMEGSTDKTCYKLMLEY